ncbi:LCP family protein [Actinospica sp. MGRD01-02]|uniref:LCP family protein n=1 Tax=Actinospica acidithermotolerans TaxID=2828514 RepID=A0A941EC38_9ACTN|nr:LCP family protein [Actinospica acidithermotolerans]MBR7827718.1 LCP family protein [Actinospica acidithermotolerans]
MSYDQDPWQPSGPSRRDGRQGGGDPRGGYRDPYGRPQAPYQGPPGPAYDRPGPSSGPPPWSPGGGEDEPALPPRTRDGSRRGAASAGPGRSRRGRAEPAAASHSGPGRVNDDLDLDEVDPRGRARRRAAKEAALAANPKRRRRALKYTAWATAGTLVAVGVTGFYVVHHLLGNVQTVSLDNLKNRPAATKANALGQVPLNILVLGSQTRDGQTEAVHVGNASKDGTDLSDTAFLVHISANHKWTEVISIPRDLFVPIPACQDRLNPSVTHQAQSEGQFYEAMNEGGPACAVATVEQMTNIRVDHFVELTFDAFIDLTNAVGGVQICVPEPGIDDPNYSGLVLSAGLHTVTGNQALAFVRDRHGLAGGMDTQRIRMQQQFMTALFDKLTANGTLENPVTLYKIANAVTSNITVDSDLDNFSTMSSIAEAVGTINKKYMQYITAPYVLDSPGQYSYDEGGNHSSPSEPGFDELWNYMRNDQPLPGSPAAAQFGTSSSSSTPTASASATASASVNPSPTVALKEVSVKVDNGTDISGEAHNAITYLTGVGMTASLGNGGYSGYTTTTIYYPPGDQAEADTVANQVAGSVVKESSNVSSVTLVIGTNAPRAVVAASTTSSTTSGSGSSASTSASPTATISAEARSGDENICSDLPAGQYGGHP